jgi:hypothetical protein
MLIMHVRVSFGDYSGVCFSSTDVRYLENQQSNKTGWKREIPFLLVEHILSDILLIYSIRCYNALHKNFVFALQIRRGFSL